MNRLAALLLFAPIPALANPPSTQATLAVEAVLAPKQVHEECAALKAGESRRYTWKSSAPLDFNIHWHKGNEVFYPVKRDNVGADAGTFTAKAAEDYCWMWTARAAGAKLEGRIGP